MRSKCLLGIFFIILIIHPSFLWGQTLAAYLKPGLLLYKIKDYDRAATSWVEVAKRLTSASSEAEALKIAGLAYVLATIALEKEGDARAYETWSQAIKCFLEGMSSWEIERQKIAEKVRIIKDYLRASSGARGLPYGMEDEDIFLLELDEAMALTKYIGPKPGLKIKSTQKKETASLEPSEKPTYYGRPILIEEKTTNAEDTLKSTQLTPLPIHGIIPEEEISTPQKETISQEIVVEEPLSKRDITDAEILKMARTAWRYFEKNYQNSTGFVNGVKGYPFATMWDIASGLAGFIAAEQLGIISKGEFLTKAKRLLSTLASMPLYNNELPNREYSTKTGKMVDLRNRPSNKGSGWSAIDIGRLLIWLKITQEWYPELKEGVLEVVKRWHFNRLNLNKEMYCAFFDGKSETLFQEGRLGYEQYAAMGYKLWGIDVRNALDYKETKETEVFGFKLPYDTRPKSCLTSEPFLLGEMELGGINEKFREIANTLYQVQKRRWQETGILTAVSEDCIDRPPWFIYNCVVLNGAPWLCVAHNLKKTFPEFKSISAKVALGFWAVYGDDYAWLLKEKIEEECATKMGYYAGIYEKEGVNKCLNVNTNAVILEAMLYLKRNKQAFLKIKNGGKK